MMFHAKKQQYRVVMFPKSAHSVPVTCACSPIDKSVAQLVYCMSQKSDGTSN